MLKLLWTFVIGYFIVSPGIIIAQQGSYYSYDDNYENSYVPKKPCRVTRPGDPDLSLFDIISSYHFNENYWEYIGVQKTYGSTGYQRAYHFEEYANLTIESSQVFPDGVPQDFSFECAFRMPNFVQEEKWNLFELSDYQSQTTMSLALNPIQKNIEISLPKYDGSLQQVTFDEIDIFDHYWHKIMFGVTQDHIRLWVDCEPIPVGLNDFNMPIDVLGPIDATYGAFTIARTCQTKNTVPLDLQWMIFSCDKDKPEHVNCDDIQEPIKPKKYSESGSPSQYEITTAKQSYPKPSLPFEYESTTTKEPFDLSFISTPPNFLGPQPDGPSYGLRGPDISTCPEQCPQGLPGPPGPPGAPGNTPLLSAPISDGLPGPKGEMGVPGPPGPPGIVTDANNTLLLPGAKGPPGLQGLPGTPGLKGEPGVAGLLGPRGLPGSAGERGEKGEVGAVGMQGEPGKRGFPGADGIPGINGIPGQAGPTGPAGPPGLPGLPGLAEKSEYKNFDDQEVRDICREVVKEYIKEFATSFVGPPGPPGKPGIGYMGPRGLQGIQGEKGMRGQPGERGFPGVAGIAGVQGDVGPQGPPGHKGDRGNDGIGLPGPPGSEGPRGYPGIGVAGKTGRQGEPGKVGPQGEPGVPGLDGANGICPDCSSYQAAMAYPMYLQQQRNSKGPQNTKGP